MSLAADVFASSLEKIKMSMIKNVVLSSIRLSSFVLKQGNYSLINAAKKFNPINSNCFSTIASNSIFRSELQPALTSSKFNLQSSVVTLIPSLALKYLDFKA